MNELKPCPFCGSGAKIIRLNCRATQRTLYKAHCTSLACNARTQNKRLKREAVELWNGRVNRE